ncbi:SKP1-like protein 11 [Cynara cardunculus var. scolymus]|uniref:SKP1-like protein n=1 Tax=Cynara cardunculus var. scolymus TaxID=59895 RepID=A0A124SCI9_CYNCS|nr:SKP1-like protein 11 [Cynara cardunculus var. scolymus]KVH93952.1 hypothetical protein Ccrd_003998 [Cynara cardunculus var. scolymus]
MSKKMLTFMSKDKQQFTIEEEFAVQSVTIRNMVEEDCASSVIPLPNVHSETLTLVIEYLNKQASVAENDLKKFVDEKQISTLLDLAKAASYLDIKGLMDLACEKLADLIKDMTVEELREIFQIENDFTPEEEQALRAEFPWAFEV